MSAKRRSHFIVQCLVFLVQNLRFEVLGSVFVLGSVGGLPPRVFRFSWRVTPVGAAQVVRLCASISADVSKEVVAAHGLLLSV